MEQEFIEEKELLMDIAELSYHPFSEKIYVNRADYDLEALINSITQKGLLNSITISNRNEVLDGIMRVEAYKKLGKTQIHCRVKNILETDIHAFILAANLYRVKTEQEIMKETYIVYEGLQRHQGVKQSGQNLTPKEQAIKTTCAPFSPRTFQKYIEVIKLDEKLPGNKLLKNFEDGKMSITKALEKGKQLEKNKEIKKGVDIKKHVTLPPYDFFTTDNYSIYNKSNYDMSEVMNNSVSLVITSPPYFKQRKYGNSSDELGRERTVQEYFNNLKKTMKEVYRTLSLSGNVFVNIADTYSKNDNHLIPENFVLMMVSLGFHKVKTIIWRKKYGLLIGDETRRPRTTFEYLYWFVKDTEKYTYNPIQIPTDKEIKLYQTGGRRNADGTNTSIKMVVSKPYKSFSDFIDEQDFLDVITTNTAAYESALIRKNYGDHGAIFPLAIPLYTILTCSAPNQIVMDPYMGSGQTMIAAQLMGRKAVGFEIEADYFNISKQRLNDIGNEIDLQMAEHIDNKFYQKLKAA